MSWRPISPRSQPGVVPPILDHVLVLGGSAAGMLAAGAIAPHVRRVTLVERDVLAGSGPRKGLPQARHANNLTPVACTLMEGWFPGIIDALVAAGDLDRALGETESALMDVPNLPDLLDRLEQLQ